jgi:hypothetical protein
MAAIVGLTEQRLRQLVAEGLPKSGRDGYPLAAAVQWIIAYWKKRAVASPLTEARRRKIEADASNSELVLARRREQFVDTDTVVRVYGEECSRLRTRMLVLPAKIAPAAFGAKSVREVEAVVRRLVIEALEELSGGGLGEKPNSAGSGRGGKVQEKPSARREQKPETAAGVVAQ